MNSQAGDSKHDLKSEVDTMINQDRVVIFSKETCPFCVDAKNVFKAMGQSYSEVDLSDHPQGRQVQATLKDITGASTVPRVFVDGKCIGGGSDTVEMYKTGKLEKILKENSDESQPQVNSKTGQGESMPNLPDKF